MKDGLTLRAVVDSCDFHSKIVPLAVKEIAGSEMVT